jgi:hypothetical protein
MPRSRFSARAQAGGYALGGQVANGTVETGVAVLWLQNGNRWQFLGRAPSRVAPRDAIDEEFFGRATKPSSLSPAWWATVVLYLRGRPIHGARLRMNRPLRSAFPMSHK